ncbi:MAG: CHAT domain-containing protein [Planctomycetaceae bacterium]
MRRSLSILAATLLAALLLPHAGAEEERVVVTLTCPVVEVFPGEGARPTQVRVARGSLDGLVSGTRGMLFRRSAEQGVYLNSGKGEIVSTEERSALVRVLAPLSPQAAAALEGALLDLRVEIPSSVPQGVLFTLYLNGIVFLDPQGNPIPDLPEMLAASAESVDQPFLDRMPALGAAAAATAEGTVERGRLAGRLLSELLAQSNAEDYRLFLRSTLERASRHWGETRPLVAAYSEWLLLGAPLPAPDLLQHVIDAGEDGEAVAAASASMMDEEVEAILDWAFLRPKEEYGAWLDPMERLLMARTPPPIGLLARLTRHRAHVLSASSDAELEAGAADAYRKAAELYRQAGDAAAVVDALFREASEYEFKKDLERARRIVAEARAEATTALAEAKDPAAVIAIRTAECLVARLEGAMSDGPGARAAMIPAIEACEASDDPRLHYSAILLLESLFERASGDPGAGDPAEYLDRIEALANRVQDDIKLNMVAQERGFIDYRESRWLEAMAHFRRASEFASRARDKSALARGISMVASCEHALGRPEKALARHEEAIRLREELGEERPLAWNLRRASTILRELGELARARPMLARALELYTKLGQEDEAPAAQWDLVALDWEMLGMLERPAALADAVLAFADSWRIELLRAARLEVSNTTPDQMGALKARLELMERFVAAIPDASPDLLAELDHARGRVLEKGRDYPAAAAAYTRAAAHYAKTTSFVERVVCLYNSAAMLSNTPEREKALEELAALRVLIAAELAAPEETQVPQVAAEMRRFDLLSLALSGSIWNAGGEHLKTVETLAPAVDLHPIVLPPTRLFLLEQLAAAYRALGEGERVVATAGRMVALAGELEDRVHQSRIAFELGEFHWGVGAWEAARQAYVAAEAFGRQAQDASSVASSLGAQAQCLWNLARHAEAIALHEQALALWRGAGDQWNPPWNLLQIGRLRKIVGDRPGARKAIEEALALYGALGEWRREAELRIEIGMIDLDDAQPAGPAGDSGMSRVPMQELRITCAVTDYTGPSPGREAEFVVARGRAHGIRIGSVGSFYAKNEQGRWEMMGRGEVVAVAEEVARVRFLANSGTAPESLPGAAHIDLLALVPADLHRGQLLELYVQGITFLDQAGQPIPKPAELLQATNAAVEEAATVRIVEGCRAYAASASDDPVASLRGSWKGWSTRRVLAQTTLENVRAFLRYVEDWSGDYIGDPLSFAEQFHNWVAAGASASRADWIPELEAAPDEGAFRATLAAIPANVVERLYWFILGEVETWGSDRDDDARRRLELLQRISAARGDDPPALLAVIEDVRGRVASREAGGERAAADAYRRASDHYLASGNIPAALTSRYNSANELYWAQLYDEALAEAAECRALAAREGPKATDPWTIAQIPLREALAIRLAARIANARGEYRSVVEELVPIIDRYADNAEPGSRQREIDLLDLLAKAQRALGEGEEAARIFERMARIASELGDSQRLGTIYFEIGELHFQASLWAEALDRYLRAAELGLRAGDKDAAASAYGAAGQTLWNLGDFQAAIDRHAQGMRLREESGSRSDLAWQMLQVARIRVDMGDREAARAMLDRALEIRLEMGHRAGEAEVRMELGKLHLALSSIEPALAEFEKARDLYESIGMVPDQARAIEKLAEALLKKPDAAAAAAQVALAIELFERIGAKSDLCGSLIWRARILVNLGVWEEARASYARAWEFATDYQGLQVDILTGLADLNHSTGHAEEATASVEKALAAAELLGDIERRISALQSSSSILAGQGRFASALDSIEKILVLARESGKRPALVTALTDKAWQLTALGRLAEARTTAESALPIADANGDPVAKAWLMNTIGNVARAFGNIREEIRFYDEGIALMKAAENRYGEAILVFNRSNALIVLRDLDTALTENRRAAELAGDTATAEFQIAMQWSYGEILGHQGKHAEAEQVLSEALTRARVSNPARIAGLAEQLARVQADRGDFDAALATLEEARALGVEQELGIILAKAGRDAEAEPVLARTVEAAAARGGAIPWEVLYLLGLVQYRSGNAAEALATLERASQEIERGEGALADDRARARYRADKTAVYKLLIKLLLAERRVDDALRHWERAKAVELTDIARRSGTGDDPHAAMATEFEVQESRMEEMVRVELRREPRDEEKLGRLRAALVDVRKRRAKFIESLARKESLFDRYTVRPMELEKLKRHLGEGMLAISPVVLDDVLVVFAITPTVLTHFEIKVSSQEVASLVAAVLAEMDAGRLKRGLDVPEDAPPAPDDLGPSLERVRTASRRLYDLLLRRAVEELGVPKTLIVSASGVLRYLPFAALLDGNTWVVERMSVVNVTSLVDRDPPPRASAEDRDPTVLAFADPDGTLKGARTEMDALLKTFPGAVIFRGANATLAALRDKVLDPGFEILHFATHGRLNSSDPELSNILLYDTPLTYDDIPTLDLAQTRLVVLSACETAARTGGSGGEIAGIAFQFQRTPVQAVLATLWPVDDDATADLMADFYRLVDEGQTYTDALVLAQRGLLNKGRADYLHPAFWAPFILMGSP